MAIEAEAEEGLTSGEAEKGGGSGATSGGAAALEREVTPAVGATPLAALAWHPAHAARLLALHAGGIVDYTVCERVTVAWGAARGGLVWTGGGPLAMLTTDVAAQLDDISHVMKKRAQTDYGLKVSKMIDYSFYENEKS